MESSEKLAKLDELFGSYKAEWLRGKIFDFLLHQLISEHSRTIGPAFCKVDAELARPPFCADCRIKVSMRC